MDNQPKLNRDEWATVVCCLRAVAEKNPLALLVKSLDERISASVQADLHKEQKEPKESKQ